MRRNRGTLRDPDPLLLPRKTELRIVLRDGIQPGVRRFLQIARLGFRNAELDPAAEHGLSVQLTVAIFRNHLDRALRRHARPVAGNRCLEDLAAGDVLVLCGWSPQRLPRRPDRAALAARQSSLSLSLLSLSLSARRLLAARQIGHRFGRPDGRELGL